MGCDIHGYIEYKTKDSDQWWQWGNQILGPRNYGMFGLLANVRCDGCVYPPRGFPRDSSIYDYWLYVVDHATDENECTRNLAEEWVKNGSSFYEDETKIRVSDPDWHSASWLTTKEFERVMKKYEKLSDDDAESPFFVEYKAALAAMLCLPNARLVFWFDN